MKRIIICFDGTWNRIDADEPTNVLMMATGITPKTKNGVAQVIHYDEGVGTSGRKIKTMIDGALGRGVLQNLSEAYRFLMFNYDPHDEVYVFGFSRGAFTARSFIGLIRSVGIIQRDHVRSVKKAIKLYKKGFDYNDPTLLDFRAKHSRHISTCGDDETHRCDSVAGYEPGSSLPFKFRYIGLWDTVESIGLGKVAWSTFRKRTSKAYVDKDSRYHDHLINGLVVAGRHAVAIDENRQHFHSEPWGEVDRLNVRLGFEKDDPQRPIQEKFFPGDHGSVGGGGDIRGLSDGAFDWILEGAKDVGLELDTSPTSSIYQIFPDFQVSIRNTSKPTKKLSLMNSLRQTRAHKPKGLFELHESAQRRWVNGGADGSQYNPKGLHHLKADLDKLTFSKPIKFKAARVMISDPREGGNFTYHTIVKGETLGKLAKTYLGKANKYKELFELNSGIIHDPDKIYPGQVIRVPAIHKDSDV